MSETTQIDAVKLCTDILKQALPKVVVSGDMPPSHPKRPYVMPSLTGYSTKDFIDRPLITLTCWDATDQAARCLATNCTYALQREAEIHPQLSAVELVAIVRDEYAPKGFGCYDAQLKLTINEP